MLMFAVISVYFFTDACYSFKGVDYTTLAYAALFGQFFTPCVLPLAWLYLMNLQGHKPGHATSAFWIIAPVFLFTSAALLHVLIGTDNEIIYFAVEDGTYKANLDTDRMYLLSRAFKVIIFRIVLLFEVMVMMYYLVQSAVKTNFKYKNIVGFFKEGQAVSPFHLMHFIISSIIVLIIAKILIQRNFLIQHQEIAVLISLGISLFILLAGVVSFFSGWDEICFDDMHFNIPRSYNEEAEEIIQAAKVKEGYVPSAEKVKAEPVVEQPQPKVEPEEPQVIETTEEEETNEGGLQIRTPQVPVPGQATFGQETTVNTVLLGKFEDLIINRQMFLTPGLTINDIASKLGTNRTYISQLVNDNYHMPFPELLNNLRIDYAEQYILHNREAKQNEVARACGFPSASSFNVIFKKITGVTPRIWLATYSTDDE